MEEKTVMDALVQMKRTGNLLNELADLTQQLGQSIDRNDQVSIQLIIAMREEPLAKEALPDLEEAGQLAAVLNGGPLADGEGGALKMLSDQVAQNRRRLKQVMDLDRVLNQRMGREKSVYQ